MARALWKGAISFGLVNIPIELHTAVRDNRPRFRMLHAADKSPIKFQRVCAREGKPVAWEDLVKGYEYEKGRFVVLTKEDFQTAALEKSRTVDILDFVNADEIDDRFFETPYYVLPAKGGERAYALLREAIRESGRIGIAKIILRETQHLAALEVIGRRARAHHDAVRRRAGRHLLVRLSRGERSPRQGARDGEGARREPRRRVGARQVHRRVPRQPDEGDPREAEGPRAAARDAGGAALGGGRRPHGAAPAKPRGREEARGTIAPDVLPEGIVREGVRARKEAPRSVKIRLQPVVL